MAKPLWMWGVFFFIVLLLLVLDLGVLHRRQRVIGARESMLLSAGYITIGVLFGGWVWLQLGALSGKEYLTGFLVEKTLALDNIFVISLIFSFFAIPKQYQHRVLFWGLMGVVVLRGIMIGLGAAIIARFSWVLYLFAAFLILTGIKMLWSMDTKFDIANSRFLALVRRVLPVTPALHGPKFTVRLPAPEAPGGTRRHATPLLVALLLIEFVDIIFAVDSIPAVFAITTDPFVVYTSNIFAILGLRALYFALDAVIHRFAYLKYALAMVLIFIGGKVFVADLVGLEKFPASVSLLVTLGLLIGGVLYSIVMTRTPAAEPARLGTRPGRVQRP